MNERSSLLLIGVGTSGSAIARGVGRAYGDGIRIVLADTDATTGQDFTDFVLLGGERLAGRGTGGDPVSGSLAAEESVHALDEHLEGVRLAVVVTALGGGTGSGATTEIAKHLTKRGIPSIVFATTPFVFESEARQRTSRGAIGMLCDVANATFLLPLDKLVDGIDNMDDALRRAVDTVASGVTLFWRLVEKPGYIRMDAERIRHLLANAGRGRFATVTTRGPGRAAEAIDKIIHSDLLTASSGPVASIVCGVLAGNDLLLSEVGEIADGVRNSFAGLSFDLATVNDEATFSGRLSVVVLLFEASTKKPNEKAEPTSVMRPRRARRNVSPVAARIDRFNHADPSVWRDENLDVPTFLRKGLQLDF